MCRSARHAGGRRRPRTRGGAILALAAALCLAPFAGHAQGTPPQAQQQVTGEVIDIVGQTDRPRGDTRLPWAPPDGFTRESDVPFGRALREEVLTPVDRNEVRRLLELERTLGR